MPIIATSRKPSLDVLVTSPQLAGMGLPQRRRFRRHCWASIHDSCRYPTEPFVLSSPGNHYGLGRLDSGAAAFRLNDRTKVIAHPCKVVDGFNNSNCLTTRTKARCSDLPLRVWAYSTRNVPELSSINSPLGDKFVSERMPRGGSYL